MTIRLECEVMEKLKKKEKGKYAKVLHLKVPNFQENKLLMNKRKIAYFRGVGHPYCQNSRLSGHPETDFFIKIDPF